MNYERTVRLVNEILAQYKTNVTLRQIYYRLVAMSAIPNKRSAYTGLSSMLVKAREIGAVDDTRIEDSARSVFPYTEAIKAGVLVGEAEPSHETTGFVENAKVLFQNLGVIYSKDMWERQAVYVEVWIEKDALSRVVVPVVRPLRVVVCPSRGYSSYTYIKRQAVDERFSLVPKEKPIIILDFRDHDPSGIQMTEDLQNRFNKYADREVLVKRIALTIDQVKKYNLSPNPTKRLETDPSKYADPRAAKYVAEFGDKCWELDAIDPKELPSIVTNAINRFLDLTIWNEDLHREALDKAKLQRRFKRSSIRI